MEHQGCVVQQQGDQRAGGIGGGSCPGQLCKAHQKQGKVTLCDGKSSLSQADLGLRTSGAGKTVLKGTHLQCRVSNRTEL